MSDIHIHNTKNEPRNGYLIIDDSDEDENRMYPYTVDGLINALIFMDSRPPEEKRYRGPFNMFRHVEGEDGNGMTKWEKFVIDVWNGLEE